MHIRDEHICLRAVLHVTIQGEATKRMRDSVSCHRLAVTKDTISIVAVQRKITDTGRMKRTVQVNVKMTEADFQLLRKAAEKRWPDAEMTNSGIVLALARIAARQVLGKK